MLNKYFRYLSESVIRSVESFRGHLAHFFRPNRGGLAIRPEEVSEMPAKACHQAKYRV